jgi:hypothetical protein
MGDTPLKAKRKRRRWTIAIVILSAACLAGWWYWPRGDARFVGKWQLSTDPYGYWDLRSNGVAVWMLNRPRYGRAYTWWRLADDRLEIGCDENVDAPKWMNWLLSKWNTRLPRRPLLYNGVIFRLLKIESDRIFTVEVHYDIKRQVWVDTQRLILLTHPE